MDKMVKMHKKIMRYFAELSIETFERKGYTELTVKTQSKVQRLDHKKCNEKKQGKRIRIRNEK